MSQYRKVNVNISQGQLDKIKKAIQAGSQVSIRLWHEDLSGERVLAFVYTSSSQQTEKRTKTEQK